METWQYLELGHLLISSTSPPTLPHSCPLSLLPGHTLTGTHPLPPKGNYGSLVCHPGHKKRYLYVCVCGGGWMSHSPDPHLWLLGSVWLRFGWGPR